MPPGIDADRRPAHPGASAGDICGAAIGFVPQETFLFSDTIAQNIASAAPTRPSHEILDAARSRTSRQKFSSSLWVSRRCVGERGITLSGGQKQRTAIARAVIRNFADPILDDALGLGGYLHRGADSRRAARSHARPHHHLYLAPHLDRRNADHRSARWGRVAELGTHDELLARNGYYAALAEKQARRRDRQRLRKTAPPLQRLCGCKDSDILIRFCLPDLNAAGTRRNAFPPDQKTAQSK